MPLSLPQPPGARKGQLNSTPWSNPETTTTDTSPSLNLLSQSITRIKNSHCGPLESRSRRIPYLFAKEYTSLNRKSRERSPDIPRKTTTRGQRSPIRSPRQYYDWKSGGAQPPQECRKAKTAFDILERDSNIHREMSLYERQRNISTWVRDHYNKKGCSSLERLWPVSWCDGNSWEKHGAVLYRIMPNIQHECVQKFFRLALVGYMKARRRRSPIFQGKWRTGHIYREKMEAQHLRQRKQDYCPGRLAKDCTLDRRLQDGRGSGDSVWSSACRVALGWSAFFGLAFCQWLREIWFCDTRRWKN